MSRVFIVLATWNPPPALFDRQIASLSRQTFRDWAGVVVDDASHDATKRAITDRLEAEPRLRFVPHRERVGFYQNFERGLTMAPATCDYVAFCDQDDRWAPQKLARQVGALDAMPERELCYSDLRLVDGGGKSVAESFWSLRPHGRRAREVLFNNVVTGSTALFRRRLLDVALPFPNDTGGAFHDHWLALCAMACGKLAYLDEPLVDYTQHARNELGAQALAHVGKGALWRFLGGAVLNPRGLAEGLNDLASYAVAVDARLRAFAGALHARVPSLPSDMARALRPFLRSRRAARVLDLAGPTFIGSLAAGEETDLAPLKVALGIGVNALHRKAGG